MKVKVINKNLNDLQDNVFRPIGSIFECDDERAEYLLKNKAIEIVEESKKEEAPKVKIEVNIDSKKIAEKVIEVKEKPKKKKTSKK